MNADTTLRKLGFTEYEIKIYLSLLQSANAKASDIAFVSQVPRNKVYEVLEGLRVKGYIMENATSPKTYAITSVHRIANDIDDKRKEIDDLANEANALIAHLGTIQQKVHSSPVSILKSKEAITQKIAAELLSVQNDVCSVIRSAFDYGITFRVIKKAVSRGVRVRLIAVSRDDNRYLVNRIKAGEEIRIYNEEKFGPFGTRLCIFDNRACRITVGKPEIAHHDNYVTIWSESPSMVRMVKREFETLWEGAYLTSVKDGKLLVHAEAEHI